MRCRSWLPPLLPAVGGVAAAAAALSCPAYAAPQDPAPDRVEPEMQGLVNLDTPDVRARGDLAARLEVRAFVGDEDLAYTGFGLHYGLGGGLEAIVRGAFADRRTRPLVAEGATGAIRHGGTDVEIAARFRPRRQPADPRFSYAAQVGVSFAGTPAQEDPFLTVGAMAAARLGDRGVAYLNPRAVLIDDNALVGIGLGGHVRLSDRFVLLGDYTPMVAGDNTRDSDSGRRMRRDVYGFGVRYAHAADPARARWDIEVGYTNGLGRTTGFGLTPGLGDSGAFYAALGYAR